MGRLPSYTVPYASPLYGPPPYHMVEGRILIVSYDVDSAAADRSVSPPLTRVPDSKASIFIGDMLQLPHAGKFHECGVVLTVRHGDVEAPYTPYLWTSTEEAMLVGREVYGMPKVLCDDDTPLRWSGNQIHGVVKRRGQEIASIDFNIERRADPEEIPRRDSRLTVRTIPDPTGRTVSRREVLQFPLTDYRILEAWGGSAVVRIQTTVMSRVHELAPREAVLSGHYLRVAWTMGAASILAVEES